MKPVKKSVLSDLRAAISKQMTSVHAPAAPKPEKEIDPPAPPRPEKKATASAPAPKMPPTPKEQFRSGRGVQFYLDDRDRKLIAHLAVSLASQDRRVSDSQVIKTAIRFASSQPIGRLLEICDEVKGLDRRRHAKKPKRGGEKP